MTTATKAFGTWLSQYSIDDRVGDLARDFRAHLKQMGARPSEFKTPEDVWVLIHEAACASALDCLDEAAYRWGERFSWREFQESGYDEALDGGRGKKQAQLLADQVEVVMARLDWIENLSEGLHHTSSYKVHENITAMKMHLERIRAERFSYRNPEGMWR